MSRAVATVGLVSIVSALRPGLAPRLRLVVEVLPSVTPPAAQAATVAVGVVLLAVAGGLRRRKRRAWTLAVMLSVAATVLHLLKGLDIEEATLSLALLVLLLRSRRSFLGAADPRSAFHTVTVFFGSSVAAVGTGLAVVLADQDGGDRSFTASSVVEQVLLGLVGVPGPLHFPNPDRAGEVAAALSLLGGVVLMLTIASLLRPAGGPRSLDVGDEARLRTLLSLPVPQDSLGYFALRRDKSIIFSPTGKAAVAYRVVGGVSLAAGDPVGDPEAWPGAISAWLAEADRYAWLPGVLGATERAASAYQRAGLDALELGDEAVIEVEDFTLEGRDMRAVRQAVGRTCRQGLAVTVCRAASLQPQELEELALAAHRWRGSSTERGFAMALGRLGDPEDGACWVVRARHADASLAGLLYLVPWGADGLSLDVMRRDPLTGNGVMELMVTELMTACRAAGITRVSMNFAVFRSVFDRAGRLGAGPVLRLWHRCLLAASRFWQIESLYRANAKYSPTWSPRYLCFRSARDVPQVTVAALRAEAIVRLPGRPLSGRRDRRRAASAVRAPAAG